jgi:outer membrane protein assembly factor BamB
MISTPIRLVLGLLTLQAANAADWPQWRGPERNGHVPAGSATLKTLPVEPKVVWRVKVGDGLASPVVAGGTVFHLDNQGGKETLHALEAESGKARWSVPLDDAFKDSQSTPGPRCTPLVNDGRVYVQSCRGVLHCLDAKDGKQLWRVNYVTDLGAVFIGEKGQAAGATRHGYNGSPLIDGPNLIACAGGTNGASVVCLDKKTGRVVWKSQSDTASYAPPILATLAGRSQVVAFTVEGLIGLEPGNGKLLWRVPFKTTFGRHVTTPVVAGEMVAVSSHEFGIVGVRVRRDGGGFAASVAWTNKPAAINFASPVVDGKHLYGVGPAKNVVCVDMNTGELAWSKEGYFTSAAGKSHGAFLVLGRSLLLLTDGGQLIHLAADPSGCRELGRAQVSGFNWCNPAWAGGRLYLRDAKDLICIGLQP